MAVLLSQLASIGKRFKGFLAFAAFILLCLVALFSWAFSKGSFDKLVANFWNLSKDQFFWLVIIVMGLLFLTVLLLITLAYHSVENDRERKSMLVYTVVHEEQSPAALIDGAEVVLLLPDPAVKKTLENGSATFVVPAEFNGKKVLVTAKKEGYLQAASQQLVLRDGTRALIQLKRPPIHAAPPISITIDKVTLLETIDGNAKTLYTNAGMFGDLDVYGRGHRLRINVTNFFPESVDVVSVHLRLTARHRAYPPTLKYDKLVMTLPHTRLPVEELKSPVRWLDVDDVGSVKELGEGRIRLGPRGTDQDSHQISCTIEATGDGLWIYSVEAEFVKQGLADRVKVKADQELAILLRGV